MELKEALFIVLAFLFPLMVYCLVLAVLNRRPHPVLVAGPWDFLGIVLALSGFLVVGGPAILSNLTTSSHGLFAAGPAADGESGVNPRQVFLVLLLVLYFAALVGGILVVLLRRRDVTGVYNVAPAVFDEVFGQVLDQLGFSWTRAGNRFYVRVSDPVAAAGAKKMAASPEAQAVIEVDPFPMMHHVSVRWDEADRPLRQEVEGELGRALSEVTTRYNPVGGWLLSATAMLFLVLVAVLLLLLMARVLTGT
jgi:hypothetical protein